MNEEVDDTEFYHQDFTTASEWEIFIARIEEVIHQWYVQDKKADDQDQFKLTEGAWMIREEKIQFADVEFVLSHHRDIKNTSPNESLDDGDDENKQQNHPIENNRDFYLYDSAVLNPKCLLGEWYNLKEFITLTPFGNIGIASESQIKILLSSIQIAVSNTNCAIPIFIQIRDKWQQCFLGVYEGNNIRTNFEMIHLRKGPQHCQYLTGLLDLFKTKIISPVTLDPINVSVQLTYQLSDFGNCTWKQDLPDIDNESSDIGFVYSLPFGVTFDPVSTIVLKATWSNLPDHLIIDTENYSDFDPLQAPQWSLLVKMAEQPVCLLSEALSELLQITNNFATVYEVLGDFATSSNNTIDNPLDLLTESKIPTISNVIKRAARNSLSKVGRGVAPLSESVLVPVLYFLFPDADEELLCPYTLGKDKDNVEDNTNSANLYNVQSLCAGFKTCVEDSLPWRLSIIMAQSLIMMGGIRAFAHLWFEIVQEMRYRWEKSIPVPGLASGFPDARTCLLHQKLQMLNCCIERKKAREARQSAATSIEREQYYSEDSSTDEDEFFDCSTEKPEEDKPKRKYKPSLWDQPVGRLGLFGDLKLIKTGEPFYIPATQEPVPKTEDQLEEDTDVLLQLGSDSLGSELRAKMMSASLLSDMESFKAANPGSILDDFIRWYSPRDWIEEDELDEWGQKKGRLSSRMLITDNTWVEMWESAKPVPANRQKRLFDDTREAEKVLHFLDSRNLSQIAEMLLAVLSQCAIYKISLECEQINDTLPDAKNALQRIIKLAEKLSRDTRISARRYEVLAQEMTSLELSISQANSLGYKFNPAGDFNEKLNAFLEHLVAGREVVIEDGSKSSIGSRIITMYSEALKTANMITGESVVEGSGNFSFPQAHEREFVMRVDAVKPAAYSNMNTQLFFSSNTPYPCPGVTKRIGARQSMNKLPRHSQTRPFLVVEAAKELKS